MARFRNHSTVLKCVVKIIWKFTETSCTIHTVLMSHVGSSLLPQCWDRLWGQHSPLSNGYWKPFSRVKRQGHEIDHSPQSSAKVKNAWSYTSAPPYVLMARCILKTKAKFTFNFLTTNLTVPATGTYWCAKRSSFKKVDELKDLVGSGRGLTGVMFQRLPGGIEEYHEILQSGDWASRTRLKFSAPK
jgi:hypothetical protein